MSWLKTIAKPFAWSAYNVRSIWEGNEGYRRNWQEFNAFFVHLKGKLSKLTDDNISVFNSFNLYNFSEFKYIF